MQVMFEAGEDFLTVKEVTAEDGKLDLLITMYKSTGDIKAAKEMYDRYSEVAGTPWAARRQVVVDRRQPRTILVQSNTAIKDEKLQLLTYEPSAEGLVRSWAERFEDAGELDTILAKLAEKDKQFWPDT